MRFNLIVSTTLGLLSSVANSQEMATDEEILNRLQQQLEAADQGLTRGLGIVTNQNEGESQEAGDGFTNLSEVKTDSGTIVKTPTRVPENLEINIQIQFEFDSAALAASEQPALNQMCRVMQQTANVSLFQIVGHTDSAGSDEYNQRLSQLRAEEVKRHLVDDCGIEAARLQAVGYGEEFPDNKSDTRAPENRRVELQVLG
jgi:outer membrane protein OmpA-like peptidoglycan-associated protein